MKKASFLAFYLVLGLFSKPYSVAAQQQETKSNLPYFNYKNGIGFTTPDSVFSLNIRFRMQNRAAVSTVSDQDLSVNEVEARVRRTRLRFEGFAVNPKLTYYLQLSFSRGDMDWSGPENSAVNTSPNIVRDAVIFYKPIKSLTFALGQTKLPGNRQRVVSSGEQQFVDRSIVNATLNIDRDFGFFATFANNFSGFHYALKGAISTGEGRNVITTDNGLAYTGRIEILPFGAFKNKGDYFEGDLEREETPKLSLGASYSFNNKTRRVGGQTGRDLYEHRDIETYIADGVLKYRGWALSAEHITRKSPNPVTTNIAGQTRHIFDGFGNNVQLSYVFKNNFEIAGRYANVTPFESIKALDRVTDNYTLGVTKYLRAHRVKVQTNLTYQIVNVDNKNWIGAFQVELGI